MTIICPICGKEVSHRQSYYIGDGKRACRKHIEAQEYRNNAHQKEYEDAMMKTNKAPQEEMERSGHKRNGTKARRKGKERR